MFELLEDEPVNKVKLDDRVKILAVVKMVDDCMVGTYGRVVALGVSMALVYHAQLDRHVAATRVEVVPEDPNAADEDHPFALHDAIEARRRHLPGNVTKALEADMVNHPPHYTQHPSGVECIRITEHYNFNVGNAIKYLWRAGIKSTKHIEDLKKAIWYVEREIQRLEVQQSAKAK